MNTINPILKLIDSLFHFLKVFFFKDKKSFLLLTIYLVIVVVYLKYLDLSGIIILIDVIWLLYKIVLITIKSFDKEFLTIEYFSKESKDIFRKFFSYALMFILFFTFQKKEIEILFTKEFYKIFTWKNISYFIAFFLLSQIIFNKILVNIIYNKYIYSKLESFDIVARFHFKFSLDSQEKDFFNNLKILKSKVSNKFSDEMIGKYLVDITVCSRYSLEEVIELGPYFFKVLENSISEKYELEKILKKITLNYNIEVKIFNKIEKFIENMGYLIKDNVILNKVFIEFIKLDKEQTLNIIEELMTSYNYLFEIFNKFNIKSKQLNFFIEFFKSYSIEKSIIKIYGSSFFIDNKEKKEVLFLLSKHYREFQLYKKTDEKKLIKINNEYRNFIFCYNLLDNLFIYSNYIKEYKNSFNSYSKKRLIKKIEIKQEEIDCEFRKEFFKVAIFKD